MPRKVHRSVHRRPAVKPEAAVMTVRNARIDLTAPRMQVNAEEAGREPALAAAVPDMGPGTRSAPTAEIGLTEEEEAPVPGLAQEEDPETAQETARGNRASVLQTEDRGREETAAPSRAARTEDRPVPEELPWTASPLKRTAAGMTAAAKRPQE